MKKAFVILLATWVWLFACAVPAAAEEASKHPEPLAWYTFDDPENLGADTSGNDNHLQPKGSPAYREEGMYGGCLYLDGNSAMIAEKDAVTGADFIDTLQDTTRQFTLTYWFKATREDIVGFDANTMWRRIVSNGCDWQAGGENGGFTFINNPDNAVNPSVFYSNPMVEYDNGTFDPAQFTANTPFTEDWTFIAIAVDAATNTIEYYINGILMATVIPKLPAGATGLQFANMACAFAFGADYYVSGGTETFFQPYKGALDQAGVFDTVLSAEDILFVMGNRQEEEGSQEEIRVGQFFEGDNVVFRFKNVRDITKAITEYSYVEVGMLDKSVKLKFWGDMPSIQGELQAADAFSLNEYKFMKIKYCGRTANPNTVFMFATSKEPEYVINGTLNFEHKNEVWEEKTFDMSSLQGWEGRMEGYQLVPTPLSDDDTESFFIEYIAFFKTQEAADAFGGITQAQKNGTDPVSLYYSRGYVNPYLGYPPLESAGAAPVITLPWIIGGAAGTIVLMAATAFVTAAIVRRKRKSDTKAPASQETQQ